MSFFREWIENSKKESRTRVVSLNSSDEGKALKQMFDQLCESKVEPCGIFKTSNQLAVIYDCTNCMSGESYVPASDKLDSSIDSRSPCKENSAESHSQNSSNGPSKGQHSDDPGTNEASKSQTPNQSFASSSKSAACQMTPARPEFIPPGDLNTGPPACRELSTETLFSTSTRVDMFLPENHSSGFTSSPGGSNPNGRPGLSPIKRNNEETKSPPLESHILEDLMNSSTWTLNESIMSDLQSAPGCRDTELHEGISFLSDENSVRRNSPSENALSARAEKLRYSDKEVVALIRGVRKYGFDFKKILETHHATFHPCRTTRSLYQKWRNMRIPLKNRLVDKKED